MSRKPNLRGKRTSCVSQYWKKNKLLCHSAQPFSAPFWQISEPTNTYLVPVSVIPGSVSGQGNSLSVPHTNKTLSFLSVWEWTGILGSFSSLTPRCLIVWQSGTGAGLLASVERVGSHRSRSLCPSQWAGWSWLSARDLETALERRITIFLRELRLGTALEKNTVHPQHPQAERTYKSRQKRCRLWLLISFSPKHSSTFSTPCRNAPWDSVAFQSALFILYNLRRPHFE